MTTTYFALTDVEAQRVRVANYTDALDEWKRTSTSRADEYAAAVATYEAAHAAWEALDEPDPDDEPQPPTRPAPTPEPVKPDALRGYEVSEIDEPTEIETRFGKALVVPPSLVLVDADGNEVGITENDLRASFTTDAP